MKYVKYILMASLVVAIVATVVIIQKTKNNLSSDDILNLNSIIIDKLNDTTHKVEDLTYLNNDSLYYIENLNNLMSDNYINYINISEKQRNYEMSSGYVDSVSDEESDKEEVNTDLTEDELISILGEDYKEKLEDDYTHVLEDDARLKPLENGDLVLYYKDIVFNDEGFDYVTLNNTTYMLSEDDISIAYEDLIGTNDLNFILTDSKEYSDINKNYLDMYFVSVTNKYKLKIRYYLTNKEVIKIEVNLIET